jgi:cytochrome c oxidase subunit 1
MGLLARFAHRLTDDTRRVRVVPAHAPTGAFRRYVLSTDHKTIGVQFLVTGAFMALLGALLALVMRVQIAWPGAEVPIVGASLFPGTGGSVPPDVYAALFTMHGTIMTFFVIIPLLTGAFGNYLIPLMIGAHDMAFPRLNALSYWLLWPGIVCMLLAFGAPGGGPGSGWTAYAPLSTIGAYAPGSQGGQTYWLLGVTFAGLSSLVGSINYLVTVAKMRAPGLTLGKLPLTVWGLCIAAVIQLLALPVLTSGAALMAMDRALGTGFFSPSQGNGEPLLWQHLFWFYSHPAVYVMVLPAMGLVSDILSTHARKAIFGYGAMVLSMLSIAGLGFIVWGHHMFTSGMDPRLEVGFLASTSLIALPSGVKVFNWIATLWGGRLRLTAAMQCAIGFVALFVIGGLSGLWLASTPNDAYLHDTYTVVAHFHYIVVGGSLLAMFGAVYHWFPKMFGRRLSEGLGTIHFVGTFVLLNCVFLPMHQLGFAGMIRRSSDPYTLPGMEALQPLNAFVTWSAMLLGLWQLWFLANIVLSLVAGAAAGRNPWRARGLEWLAASPPGPGNFDAPVAVTDGPYAYGLGLDDDAGARPARMSERMEGHA